MLNVKRVNVKRVNVKRVNVKRVFPATIKDLMHKEEEEVVEGVNIKKKQILLKKYRDLYVISNFSAGSTQKMQKNLKKDYQRHVKPHSYLTLSEYDHKQKIITNSVKSFVDYVIAIMGENPYKIVGYLSHGAGSYVVPIQKRRALTNANLAFGNRDLSILNDPTNVFWIYNKPVLEDILGKFKRKTEGKYADMPTNAEKFIVNILVGYGPQWHPKEGEQYYKDHPLLDCLVQRLFGEGPNSDCFIFNSSVEDCYNNNEFWRDILPSNNFFNRVRLAAND